MHVPSIVGAAGVIVLAAASGCGPKPAMIPPTATYGDACLSFWFTPPSDTITVALLQPVDPAHAPWPRNDAERIVFNHLYATPLVNGCGFAAVPSLMEGQPQKHSDRIVLVLRETARFWDGSSVTVDDVVESLRRGSTPYATIDSVTAIDRRTVGVFISRPDPWGASLTSPSCAVTKDTSSLWPMGSGPYCVIEEATNGDIITIRPVGAKSPVIRFVDYSGKGDTRDVFDLPLASEFDLMITSDRKTIEYAQSQAGFAAEHLTSNQTYLLLSVTRASALAQGSDVSPLSPSICVDLATNAVQSAFARGEVGGIIRGYWWTDIVGCRLPSTSPPPAYARDNGRILFDEMDQTARELAERIVALSSGSSPDAGAMGDAVPDLGEMHPIARGVGQHELSTSLARGDAFAYIVAVPYPTSDPCREAGNLIRAAPWLASSRALADVILPLVSTRPFALHRGQQGEGPKLGVNRDHYGNLMIVRLVVESP